MKKIKILTVCLCVGSLSACTTPEKTNYMSYPGYQPYAYEQTYYYQTYDGGVDYRYSSGNVNVPNSYHVGLDHSPTSHKAVDSNWVHSQNPQGYTIEITEGDKASQVAAKLYKVPKTDRTAQIKSYRGNGKAYYKGVYGTYNSYEDAQKALNNLPPNVKQGANIKNWSNIQENTAE
ncbi:hypothetical protein [Legionella hackeliae]|uniref:SPOR domain-containing protein n=1 Tax=Legionella hackeliae TaxID=449 RepID=A0A0A8UME7_LEGHA|nr:hypothetical protein [Legionella hackeliae]KTD10532.1 hypothetical protein Lhac_2900 [Legionella hackeliae]CEK10035.1 conserved exported protein of unknown function [Legionella hackeliae]STX46760.1 Uncharacterised protein [Legionella hackeliae]